MNQPPRDILQQVVARTKYPTAHPYESSTGWFVPIRRARTAEYIPCRITRPDVADFMLRQVHDDALLQKTPLVMD